MARDQASGSNATTEPTIPEGSTYAENNSQSNTHNTNQSRQPKKRKHRGGKKKRNRRQSFAAASEDSTVASLAGDIGENGAGSSHMVFPQRQFYRLGQQIGSNSNTSLDSEALLDHREQPSMRKRRDSRLGQNVFGAYRASPTRASDEQEYGRATGRSQPYHQQMSRSYHAVGNDSEEEAPRDNTPLLAPASGRSRKENYGGSYFQSAKRGTSRSTTSSRQRRRLPSRDTSYADPGSIQDDYDVNNPPSVPGSPELGPDKGFDDVMMGGFTTTPRPLDSRKDGSKDLLIDIDGSRNDGVSKSTPHSPRFESAEMSRRRGMSILAEEDVCFPTEVMSELAEEDYNRMGQAEPGKGRKRRHRRWPDLSILEEWSREEKEERSEGLRQMRINEPTLINGRLRPSRLPGWHRVEEEAPYRFTYFNEEFQSTIHAQTISELVQPGGSFEELFIPDPPVLSDSSSDEEGEENQVPQNNGDEKPRSPVVPSHTRHSSLLGESKPDSGQASTRTSGRGTPQKSSQEKPKKYGPRPTFWLDVLSPTEAEMRVISKAFGIHALTAEDIMMREAREKVELFRNYYFINYRSFEQDYNKTDFLEPVEIYVVVFREGVLSFHFSQTPHPANVRRRIRQLKDYLILSSDWISYAIIDDITDVFQPLIQEIEEDVDDIDDMILQIFHDPTGNDSKKPVSSTSEKASIAGRSSVSSEKEPTSGMDMLRRIGECRKKVMGLYRLLGNKADVIKGFAKRCNEQWEVAPKSEIGLYLGDIQDHILTMTSNLAHYETLLSRAHGNYLAHVNIRMNDRAEQNADVLGKLTVLGTIVLPLNVICGMFGMNVQVPGDSIENLNWFWGLSGGMAFFAITCWFIAKRVYNIA